MSEESVKVYATIPKGIVGSHPRDVLKTPLYGPPSKIVTVRTRHRGFGVYILLIKIH